MHPPPKNTLQASQFDDSLQAFPLKCWGHDTHARMLSLAAFVGEVHPHQVSHEGTPSYYTLYLHENNPKFQTAAETI